MLMPNFLNIYTCIDNIDSEGNIHTSGKIINTNGKAVVLNDIQYFSLDDYMNYTRKISSTIINTNNSGNDYGLFMALGVSNGEVSEDSYALDKELCYGINNDLQFQSMSIEFKPSSKIIYSGNLIVKNTSLSNTISINQIALFTRACFNRAKGQNTPTYENYMLAKENIETIEMQPGETRMFSMAIKS